MDVTLSKPLGDRTLIDGGGGTLAFQRLDGLPVYWSDPLATVASERVRLMIGSDACESVAQGDRAQLASDELLALAAQVNGHAGPADNGRAYAGSWVDAAKYFGAIEGYTDGHVYNGIVAPAANLGITDATSDGSALALTRLNGWGLIGGIEIWYPAFLFKGFQGATVSRPAPCDQTSLNNSLC